MKYENYLLFFPIVYVYTKVCFFYRIIGEHE